MEVTLCGTNVGIPDSLDGLVGIDVVAVGKEDLVLQKRVHRLEPLSLEVDVDAPMLVDGFIPHHRRNRGFEGSLLCLGFLILKGAVDEGVGDGEVFCSDVLHLPQIKLECRVGLAECLVQLHFEFVWLFIADPDLVEVSWDQFRSVSSKCRII